MEALYLQGNNLIAAKNYEEALPTYLKAIDEYQKLAGLTALKVVRDETTNKTLLELDQAILQTLQNDVQSLSLLIRSYANLGFCQWKQRNFESAIECFSEIIDFEHRLSQETSNTHPFLTELRSITMKALIRRCLSYETNQEYEKCLQDFEIIRLHYEHNNDQRAVILNLMPQYPTFQLKIQELMKKDENVAKEEGKSTWMSHLQQTLRILMISPLLKDHNHHNLHRSSITVWDQIHQSHCRFYCYSMEVTCKLGLGNELGLFNRSLYLKAPGSDLGQVICRLKVLEGVSSSSAGLNRVAFLSTKPITSYPFINLENNSCGMRNDEMIEIMRSGTTSVNSNPSSSSDTIFIPLPEHGKVNASFFVNVIAREENLLAERSLLSAMIEFDIKDFPSANVPIIPLLSTPFEITCTPLKDHRYRLDLKDFQHYHTPEPEAGLTCVRPIRLPDTTHSMYVYESPGSLGIGGKIWDSTFILIDYLSKHAKDLIKDQVIIEIGSGTGIAGLSLSFLSPRKVIMTDMAEVVPLIAKNIELNQIMQKEERVKALLKGSFIPATFLWGSRLDPTSPLLDDFRSSSLLIASDVVYYPEGYRPLIETLEWWFSLPSEGIERRTRRLILAHRHRHPQDGEFFAMVQASKVLSMTEISRDPSNAMITDVRLLLFTHKL